MLTPNLFDNVADVAVVEPLANDIQEETKDFLGIEGLFYVSDFVTSEEERKIIDKVAANEWSTTLSRRVQHYGYRYDYKSRRIDSSMNLGELPKWLRYFGQRLVQQGYFESTPDQVIVNEYLPGQGISPHVDCEPCFGDTVVSLSLGSGCFMDFSSVKTDAKTCVWLNPRSIVVLKDEARYAWKHSIAKRCYDTYNGQIVRRQRRISLTFRKVRLD